MPLQTAVADTLHDKGIQLWKYTFYAGEFYEND